MAKNRKVTIGDKVIYEQGRHARLQGAKVRECPYPASGTKTTNVGDGNKTGAVKSSRIDWHAGWYDQDLGMRHEPKSKEIKVRIWPVHL